MNEDCDDHRGQRISDVKQRVTGTDGTKWTNFRVASNSPATTRRPSSGWTGTGCSYRSRAGGSLPVALGSSLVKGDPVGSSQQALYARLRDRGPRNS